MSQHKGVLPAVKHSRVFIPWPVRATWRYLVTGRELMGAGDNATFLHDATEDYRGRPYLKLTRARWRRLARRWALGAIPCGLACLAAVSRVLPIGRWDLAAYSYALAACLAVATWAGVRLARWWPERRRNAEHIDPAAEALCSVIKQRYRRKQARSMISLPHGWSLGRETDGDREQEAVRCFLPASLVLTDPLRKQIVNTVGARLGVVDPRGVWHEGGVQLTVDITGAPVPPKSVEMMDLAKAIEAADIDNPVVGMVAGRKALSVSFKQDSPHLAMSGPSGTGKSVLAKLILTQRMSHGAHSTMLDVKRWSHRWAHELPDDVCSYHYLIEDIHEALVELGAEMNRRIRCAEAELGTFRVEDVVVEEINTLIRRLAAYWKGERKRIMNAAKQAMADEMDYDPADLDPPAQSPAIAALQGLVGMGRELQMHVHVMAQRLSANVFGGNGGDIRESFQIRFMAKWDRKLWAMLADGLPYVACPAGPRGQWGVAIDGQFHIFRAPMLTDGQARKLAMARRNVATELATSLANARAYDGQQVGREVGRATLANHGQAKALANPATLAEALGHLPVGQDGQAITIEAIRRASTRPGFPAPLPELAGSAKQYDLAELIDWKVARDGVPAIE